MYYAWFDNWESVGSWGPEVWCNIQRYPVLLEGLDINEKRKRERRCGV
jgi:hypothetical protein